MGKLEVKKVKISFVIEPYYYKNLIFDCESYLNRDNCFYPYFRLKQEFQMHKVVLATCDINDIDESQIIIYNDMPKILPEKNQISKSYLLLFESEVIRPNNWDLKKHKHFNKIFTWDDRYVDNEKYFKINFSHLFPTSIKKNLINKEKLCTLIAGNKKVNHPLELYSKRVEAIKWFENNHLDQFDLYGIGWDEIKVYNRYLNYILKKLHISKIIKPNFLSYKGKINSKKEILEKYKFAICYENAKDIEGYITEKIFDCFFAGCIPIYWGANNIIDHIPKDCFIDKRDFISYESLYDFIINMNDVAYMKYLNNIETYINSKKRLEFTADYFAKTIVETILDDIT